MDDWTDNGDGSVSSPDGQIYDYDGNWIGSENANGTWTDANGQNFTADNRPINDGGYFQNDDGSFTSIYTGETIQGGGNIGEAATTEPVTMADGSVNYPNGDVENPDGTWTFADGTTYDPLAGKDDSDPGFWNSLSNSLKSIFGTRAGANGTSNAGNFGVTSAAQAVQQLRALQQQANLNGTPAQQAAINAALSRAQATTSTTSATTWIAGGALALLALAAMRKRRSA